MVVAEKENFGMNLVISITKTAGRLGENYYCLEEVAWEETELVLILRM
jgi:hypothetical protein